MFIFNVYIVLFIEQKVTIDKLHSENAILAETVLRPRENKDTLKSPPSTMDLINGLNDVETRRASVTPVSSITPSALTQRRISTSSLTSSHAGPVGFNRGNSHSLSAAMFASPSSAVDRKDLSTFMSPPKQLQSLTSSDDVVVTSKAETNEKGNIQYV